MNSLVSRLKILDILPRTKQVHRSGIGKEAVFDTVADGWVMQLENNVSLHFPTRPPFNRGEILQITMEAKPEMPSGQ